MKYLKFYRIPLLMTGVLFIMMVVIGSMDGSPRDYVNNKSSNVYSGQGFYGPDVRFGKYQVLGKWVLKTAKTQTLLDIEESGFATINKVPPNMLVWEVGVYGNKLFIASKTNSMIIETKYHLDDRCILVSVEVNNTSNIMGTICKG